MRAGEGVNRNLMETEKGSNAFKIFFFCLEINQSNKINFLLYSHQFRYINIKLYIEIYIS